jgi:hypothetical protein
MRALMVGWMSLLMVAMLLAQGGWHPLGGWELIERLDNVQVIKIFRPDNLIGSPYPRWYPSGRGDFSPADQLLYYRWATSGQYYAYDSQGKIALDDVQIYPYLDPNGQGRFRVSRVEIMVYFPRHRHTTPFRAFGQVPIMSSHPIRALHRPPPSCVSNQGPHTLNVPQAGVWRLGTNPDPNNEVFTVQAGQLGQDFGSMFVFYLGILVSSPAAWVCGNLPGDPNFDYFIQYEPQNEEDVYQYYGLEGGVQATFGLRIWGTLHPQHGCRASSTSKGSQVATQDAKPRFAFGRAARSTPTSPP